jgi:BASS family bile acid:Na+ symporter
MDNLLVTQLVQILVPITMFTLMFAMGLTLTLADFKRVIRLPKAIIVGLLINLVILPVVGLGLAYGFELSAMLAVGLVAVAACPGGTTSNVIVHMGKGDTALSISLTAIATLITLFTLPLWVNFTLTQFADQATVIEMPVLKTAAQLALITLLPVALGMTARRHKPEWIKAEPVLSKVSTIAMIAAILGAGIADSSNLLQEASTIVVPAILLLTAAVAIGLLLPKSLGINTRDSVTIAVESSLKNIMLSFFIATNVLKVTDAAYASVIIGMVMMPVAVVIMVIYRQTNKQSAQAAT